MKRILGLLSGIDFSELDRQIAKLQALRDGYKQANDAYYGDYFASLLND